MEPEPFTWLTAALFEGKSVGGRSGSFAVRIGRALRESSHTDLLEGDRPNHLSVRGDLAQTGALRFRFRLACGKLE